MLLAIDAGNTNVVFAVYDGDERRGIWRILVPASHYGIEEVRAIAALGAFAEFSFFFDRHSALFREEE